MTCRTVIVDGHAAIVCGPRPRVKRCGCGKPATLLCDWKMGDGKTCDRSICHFCAEQVAEDKHLCREHQGAYRNRIDARRIKEP